MAFATYIRRANGANSNGWSIVGGAANAAAAINDNSDTTYLQSPGVEIGTVSANVGLDAVTIASAASTFVWHVRSAFRINSAAVFNASPPASFSSYLSDGSNATATDSFTLASTTGTNYIGGTPTAVARAADGTVTVTLTGMNGSANATVIITGITGTHAYANGIWTIATASASAITFAHPQKTLVASSAPAGSPVVMTGNLVGTPKYQDYSGTSWTQTDFNTFNKMVISGSRVSLGQPAINFYEMWNEIRVYDRPTVSGVSATATTLPTVSWTYTQAQSVGQTAAQVKIFTATTTTPETTTTGLVWTGTVEGAATSIACTTALSTGVTYYVYVKVGTGPLTGSSNANWSQAWSSAYTLIPAATAPDTPTWGASPATWSSANNRVNLSVAAGTTSWASSVQTYDLQRSDDGGTTWYRIRYTMRSTSAGAIPTAWSPFDYEAARGVTVQYRIRSTGTDASGNFVASAWSSTVTATTTVPTGTVMFATSESAGVSGSIYTNAPIQNASEFKIEESVGVFRPQGRDKAVVVHGTLTGQDGSYRFVVNSTTNRDALLTILTSQKTIVVIDALGELKYIRVIDRQFSRAGILAAPYYEFEVGYVEVDSGLVQG